MEVIKMGLFDIFKKKHREKNDTIIVIPFISVNGIEFGTSRDELWKRIGLPKKSFKKTLASVTETDVYDNYHIIYDSNYTFEAIEIFGQVKIYYNSEKLPQTYSLLLEYFRKKFNDIEEDVDGLYHIKAQLEYILKMMMIEWIQFYLLKRIITIRSRCKKKKPLSRKRNNFLFRLGSDHLVAVIQGKKLSELGFDNCSHIIAFHIGNQAAVLAVISKSRLDLLKSHLLATIVPARNILYVTCKHFTIYNCYSSVKETKTKTVVGNLNLAYIPFGNFADRCFADKDTRMQILNIVL